MDIERQLLTNALHGIIPAGVGFFIEDKPLSLEVRLIIRGDVYRQEVEVEFVRYASEDELSSTVAHFVFQSIAHYEQQGEYHYPIDKARNE